MRGFKEHKTYFRYVCFLFKYSIYDIVTKYLVVGIINNRLLPLSEHLGFSMDMLSFNP
jgi:hypothetical protein